MVAKVTTWLLRWQPISVQCCAIGRCVAIETRCVCGEAKSCSKPCMTGARTEWLTDDGFNWWEVNASRLLLPSEAKTNRCSLDFRSVSIEIQRKEVLPFTVCIWIFKLLDRFRLRANKYCRSTRNIFHLLIFFNILNEISIWYIWTRLLRLHLRAIFLSVNKLPEKKKGVFFSLSEPCRIDLKFLQFTDKEHPQNMYAN